VNDYGVHMKNYLKIPLHLILIVWILNSCSAFLFPATTDPAKKLGYAMQLLAQDRPLAADMLINDAIRICIKGENTHTLAEAYQEYAYLLTSDSSEGRWKRYFERHGFRDKTPYNRKNQAAIEYLGKAARLFETVEDYRGSLVAYIGMKYVYQYKIKDNTKACDAYKKALLSFRNRKDHEDLYIHPFDPTMKPFKITEDVIRKWMSELENCK
jgi:hypothetical protein